MESITGTNHQNAVQAPALVQKIGKAYQTRRLDPYIISADGPDFLDFVYLLGLCLVSG